MKYLNRILSRSFLLLFIAAPNSFAETPPWQWAEQFGGDSAGINASRIAVDDSGNSYVTGVFNGTAEFGSYTLTSDRADIFLVKIDSGGEVVWARGAGGPGDDKGASVCVDSAGNSYVAGSFRGNSTFEDVVVPGTFTEDVFLAKYNSAGDFQWVRSGGGSADNAAFDVALDGAGNPYITGSFSGAATFGDLPPLIMAGGWDVFVVAYSASGDEQWAVRAGGSAFGFFAEGGRGIAVDDAGDVYVAGNFVGTASFGTASFGTATVTSVGGQDAFLAKYSPGAGNWEWVTRAGGTGIDLATEVKLDSAGNPRIGGIFSGSADFGGTTLTAEGGSFDRDYFVGKYHAGGTLSWVQRAGGVGNFQGHGIAVDPEHNTYLVATFDGVATVGTETVTSAQFDNVYLAKFGPDGTHEWVVHSPGDFFHVATGVAADSSGNFFLTGWFMGTVEFGDTALVRQGSTEVFVARMGEAAEEIVPVALEIRPGSCTNPLPRKSKGVLPVAVLGSDDVDVSEIDLSTVSLWRADGFGGSVAPLEKPGAAIEDVVRCGESDGDGTPDLAIKFSNADLVQVLDLGDLAKNAEVELVISGALLDGREFAGIDSVILR